MINPTMTVDERMAYARSLSLDIGGISDEDRLMRALAVVLAASIEQTIAMCAEVAADTQLQSIPKDAGYHDYTQQRQLRERIVENIRAVPRIAD